MPGRNSKNNRNFGRGGGGRNGYRGFNGRGRGQHQGQRGGRGGFNKRYPHAIDEFDYAVQMYEDPGVGAIGVSSHQAQMGSSSSCM